MLMQHKIGTLAAVLLTSSALLATAAQAQASAEYPVAPPVYNEMPRVYGFVPRAATDGRDFLIVQDLMAFRVAGDGTLIDKAAIALTSSVSALGLESIKPVAVLFAGRAYAVFWFEGDRLTVTRIDHETGAVDGPRTVMQLPRKLRYAFAANDRTILIASGDRYHILDAEARLVARDVPIPANEREHPDAPPLLTSNGSTFLMAWTQGASQRQVYELPLDAAGRAAALPRTLGRITTNVGAQLASDGRDFLLLTWDEPWILWRIGPDGTPAPPVFVKAPWSAAPVLIWSGVDYVLFLDSFTLRLGRDGDVTAQRGPVSTAIPAGALIAAPRSGRMVYGSQIYAIMIDSASLEMVRTIGQPRAAREEVMPRIAAGNSELLVTWFEWIDFHAAIMGFDGTILAAAKFGDPQTVFTSSPAIAFDGSDYLLAGDNNGTIVVLRIAPNGQLLDRVTLPIRDAWNYDPPAIWTDGSTTLIAYTKKTGIAVAALDRRLRVRASTQLAANPNTNNYFRGPAVSWDGREWLVAFVEVMPVYAASYSVSAGVRAVRLSGAIEPLDRTPLAFGEIFGESPPRVDWDGLDFTLFWTGVGGVRAQKIRPGGSPRPDTLLLPGATLQHAAWTGASHALLVSTPLPRAAGRARVDFVTVDPMLWSIQSEATLIPSNRQFGQEAFLALAGGRTFAVYNRVANEPLYGGTWRAFVREVLAEPRQPVRP